MEHWNTLSDTWSKLEIKCFVLYHVLVDGDRLNQMTLSCPMYNLFQSGSGDARTKQEVRTALQGVSEWFDDYLGGEQGDGLEQVGMLLTDTTGHR